MLSVAPTMMSMPFALGCIALVWRRGFAGGRRL
jgi:hypothetical protein